ncbi:MAG: tetratricopeptide repeat protein [Bacteroidetes bacterium]|nr:tetratricopeptide repeat protein [Bacteroidota bacterium]MCL5266657.1 tetratricopeptide repeat protein [Bacteroidota bacterium]
MKKAYSSAFFAFFGLLLVYGGASAQSVRSSVNKGVNLYDAGKYAGSETEFKKGLEKSPDNFQAHFNLGDSYYKQGKYQDALNSYLAALPNAKSNALKSLVYHNIGNSLLKDKKIKESIEAYTKALRLNPNDQATKYNLSYALDLLKNQNKQNKDNKNKKNNKDKNKQNKNKNNQQNNRNNQQNQNKNNQQNQPQQNKISKAQAQAIFSALNNDEKNLQKQLRKMTGKPVKTAKDW